MKVLEQYQDYGQCFIIVNLILFVTELHPVLFLLNLPLLGCLFCGLSEILWEWIEKKDQSACRTLEYSYVLHEILHIQKSSHDNI